jgi:acyl-CoA oxidase
MHTLLAGCKAVQTEYLVRALEVCRTACGGHGFSHYSGLPSMVEDLKQFTTVEGENTVMLLQVARHLFKTFV